MAHFISLADYTPDALAHILDVAKRLKHQLKTTGRSDPLLAGKTLAMVFEKPSLRTRVSFAVAMTQLGGSPLLLRDDEVGLGKREPVRDIARVLSGMCDGIMARTFEHEKILELAQWSSVPVVNGLTDYNHPCQAMADLLTLREHFGELRGRTLAFVGDGNNVARSLAIGCAKFEMHFVIASPDGYRLPGLDLAQLRSRVSGLDVRETADPTDAVRSADVIVTDTWISMGQEEEKAARVNDFSGFCIDDTLMAKAPAHAVVLHCLPAYRGLEISESVFESKRSLVFQEAENRLHAQKAILAVLMAGQ